MGGIVRRAKGLSAEKDARFNSGRSCWLAKEVAYRPGPVPKLLRIELNVNPDSLCATRGAKPAGGARDSVESGAPLFLRRSERMPGLVIQELNRIGTVILHFTG